MHGYVNIDWFEVALNINKQHLRETLKLRECISCKKWLPEDQFFANSQRCYFCDNLHHDEEMER